MLMTTASGTGRFARAALGLPAIGLVLVLPLALFASMLVTLMLGIGFLQLSVIGLS
jgi:hypothetical protein